MTAIRPEHVTENSCLIDVRSPREFASGYIEGAENIPLGELERHCSRLCEKDDLVIVCASGTRAKSAQKILRDRDIPCRVLDGGMSAWSRAGRSVQGSGGGGLTVERQVRVIAGLMAALGGALSIWVNPWFGLVPLLVGLGLLHAGITDQCLLAFILSKLPYNSQKPPCCAA